ncbi:Crp/Fnr family transcriptional regulator [Desulfovibrio inopinatus]|uniref:Crp/Fnr family transcriptional regulator n=1 Tax=Desulfovibrio inopinatus TaxID=102109 RepID=UPI0003FDB2B1|nr:cyclic nucleotide-binding domain-containing protein [Desulfovibrio inopinatus]
MTDSAVPKERVAYLLDNTEWGKELTWEEVEIMSSYLSLHEYKEGEYIFNEGDSGEYMGFLVEGKISILKETDELMEKLVLTLPEGTHFGEMSIIDGERRSAAAFAQTNVVLLALSKGKFDELIQVYPYLGIKILRKIAKILSRRLRQTTGKMVKML